MNKFKGKREAPGFPKRKEKTTHHEADIYVYLEVCNLCV